MRGKANFSNSLTSFTRITPAYAGKRPELHRQSGGCQDHPRLCGEKSKLDKTYDGQAGSPPPMRGKGGKLS